MKPFFLARLPLALLPLAFLLFTFAAPASAQEQAPHRDRTRLPATQSPVVSAANPAQGSAANPGQSPAKNLSQAQLGNWPLLPEKAHTALIFIEFQKEWLAEDGILFSRLVQDKTRLRQAAARAATVLEAARRHGWTVAHAGLDMRSDPAYRLFAGGRGMLGLRGAIPAAGTWTGAGADFMPPFVPLEREFVTAGRSGASVLGNSNLDAFLRNNRIDTLIIMGFATHVCVESTLRAAHDAGYNVLVVTDASAAFTSEQDEYFARHVLHHFGAGVSAAALADYLAGGQASGAGPAGPVASAN